ncbi:MAG: SPFH domain-containing protein [Planctomycetes bacterium]|nr:SPFH domain-containing protein [Planctomycetota bacterium]
MAILDVIQYHDESGQNLATRIGPSTVNMGSMLIVHESQAAVFYRDGKALDTFGPGRVVLSTQNIPLLGAIMRIPFGGNTPFPVEVVFLNMADMLDLKWGTKEPVTFRDSEFGMIDLRAFGKFSLKIRDPKLLVGTVVGQKSVYRVTELEEWLRDVIVQQFTDAIGEKMTTMLDLAKNYNEIATMLKSKVAMDFERYGVEITAFILGAITPPPDVQEAIRTKQKLGILGPSMAQYQQKAAADAMLEAAKNPSGMAGMGVGLGAGMMMPQMMAANMQAPQQQPQQAAATATEPCPKCKAPVAKGAKFCAQCGASTSTLCVACKEPLPSPTAKFCASCGKPQTASCPKCNAVLASGAKFCAGCGSPV